MNPNHNFTFPYTNKAPNSSHKASEPRNNPPQWLEQVRSIGAVVCSKINSQDDRISLAELRGQDLENIFNNNPIPWAVQVNDKLHSLKEGLALIYENMPSYLTSLNDQIQNLSNDLAKESSSRLTLQDYLQNTFAHECNELVRNETQKHIDERLLQFSSEYSNDLTTDPKFLEYKNDIEKELHLIKVNMEELLFMEPSNPALTLEGSIQDEIKNSVIQKLEDSIQTQFNNLIFNKLESSISDHINNLVSEKIECFKSSLESHVIESNLIPVPESFNSLDQRIQALEKETLLIKDMISNMKEILDQSNKTHSEDYDKLKFYYDQCFERISARHETDIFDIKTRIKEIEGVKLSSHNSPPKPDKFEIEFSLLRKSIESLETSLTNFTNKIIPNFEERFVSELAFFRNSLYSMKTGFSKIPSNLESQHVPPLNSNRLILNQNLPSNNFKNSRKYRNIPRPRFSKTDYRWVKIFVPKDWTTDQKNDYVKNIKDQFSDPVTFRKF